MPTEIQTRIGRCPTHGTVEASREVPRITFPLLLFNWIRRTLAELLPYHCPECGADVDV